MIKLFQIWILALVFIFACDTHEKVKDKNVISEKEKDETSNLSKVFRSEECDFDCFKGLFKNKVQDLQFNELSHDYSLPNFINKIPDTLVKRYLNFNIRAGYHVGVFSEEIILQEVNYVGFKYSIPCSAGGTCIDTYLSTVSNQGKHISSLVIEGEHSDLVNQVRLTTAFLNSDKITIEIHEKMLSDNGVVQLDTIYYKNFVVDESGYIH